MFRNQYIASTYKDIIRQPPEGYTSYDAAGFSIYSHQVLPVSIGRNSDIEIVVIGHIIDPLNPDYDNAAVAQCMSMECKSRSSFTELLSRMTGRFVIFFKIKEESIVVSDSLGLRQLLFGNIDSELVITSSVELFISSLVVSTETSERKLAFVRSRQYLRNDCAWVGTETIDDRLSKVLPNHYLEVSSRNVRRMPFQIASQYDETTIIENSKSILRGTFKALSKRYCLLQQLTAGVDSRVLLAASVDVKDDARYYTFFRTAKDRSRDVEVAELLASRLNIDHRVINPSTMDESFLQRYTDCHAYPRLSNKTRHIQHHWYQRYDANVVNINGNGGEVARHYYGLSKRPVTVNMLVTLSGYSSKDTYVRPQVEDWLSDAQVFAKESNVPILDLFYWEQRMGNWGALYPYEQDMAIEELSPLNNRQLILMFLAISAEDRLPPANIFYRRLLDNLWPETLSAPINPNDKGIKRYIKNNTHLRCPVQKRKNDYLMLRERAYSLLTTR